METVGGDANNIKGLQLIGDAFDKMDGGGTKRNKQLVKSVEMLKLHIDIGASDIIVKRIEDCVVFLVDLEIVFVLVVRRVLDDHVLSPP